MSSLTLLEQRFRNLAADSDLDLAPRVGQLADLDADLGAWFAQAGETLQDGSAAAAARWRDHALARQQPEQAERLEAFIQGRLSQGCALWEQKAVGSESPSDLMDALNHARSLNLEAVRLGKTQSGELPLAQACAPLRARLLHALSKSRVDARTQGQWVRRALDEADATLVDLDEVEPARAVRQLDIGIEDLSWFAEHIATPGAPQRRVRRRVRRLRVERQERDLQATLEARYGTAHVARFERLIVGLIFFVLGALLLESCFSLPRNVRLALAIADTLACVVFLAEFFTKLRFVRGRTSWFLRHVLIDFLPSIPFGLLILHDLALDKTQLARSLRLLRLPRVARYLRLLLPLVRMVRAFGFLVRGVDRLARRFGSVMNQDVILFPTRAERRMALGSAGQATARAWRLRQRLDREWTDLLQAAPQDQAATVLDARIQAMEALNSASTPRQEFTPESLAPRALPAEELFQRLDAITPQELEAMLEPDLMGRLARSIRTFSRWPLRWFPIIHRYAPRLAPAMSDADVVAAAAWRTAAECRRHHDRWLWVADLYGTVTPAEFVDRVGTTMMRSSLRPAWRLTLFGGFYLLLQLVLTSVGHVDTLAWLSGVLRSIVGTTLIVLGGICFAVLGVGWWLRRMAGQATFFYEQTAQAQFLALLEAVKGRNLARDARLFDARVLSPEAELGGLAGLATPVERQACFEEQVRGWLVAAQASGPQGAGPVMERTVLLYRDALDGALFCDSDQRTTAQLLGNPALRQLRAFSERITPAERVAIQRLDLTRPRTSLRGPYLWFGLASRAIAQSVGRLLVEYNRNAIPLEDLDLAQAADRATYETWLRESPDVAAARRESLAAQRMGFQTTAFTALHFLDDDPARDAELEQRFGPGVRARLVNDRRLLFRQVFGTYPFHLRPLARRSLNLHRFYSDWLAQGRALLVPLRVFGRMLRGGWRAAGFLLRAVGEVRAPRRGIDPTEAEQADWNAALRKIERMRGPVALALLRARSRFDVEYLGVGVPGVPLKLGSGVDADLAFLHARGGLLREVAWERDEAEEDMRRLASCIDAGLLRAIAGHMGVSDDRFENEHRRAAAFAYRADLRGVRTLLSADAILRTAAQRAPYVPCGTVWPWPRVWLRRALHRWCEVNGHARSERAQLWRCVVGDVGGARQALVAWGRHGTAGALERGVALMAELLRHPARLSEQLVTLRIVHTLSLLDLLTYREHVYRLGGYDAAGDDAQGAFDLYGLSALGEAPTSVDGKDHAR